MALNGNQLKQTGKENTETNQMSRANQIKSIEIKPSRKVEAGANNGKEMRLN